MSSTVRVVVPFVRVDPKQNPNVQAKDADGTSAYFRAMVVAFASVRRAHPGFELELISNSAPPEPFATTLGELGVATRVIPFNHAPPAGFAKVFEGSLFLLDALDHLVADTTVLMDPDVLLVRPLHDLLEAVQDRVGAIDISYSDIQNINGLSRVQASELHEILGYPSVMPPRHFGGEFYIVPKASAGILRKQVSRAWALSLLRFEQNKSYFTTEEHVMSLALRTEPLVTINQYVRRIWTAHSFRNVTASDTGLTAWHLPAEKDRGFAALYPLVVDRSSWFWTTDNNMFISKAAKEMGLRRRSPLRLALDLVGPWARRVKELRVPLAERAAG